MEEGRTLLDRAVGSAAEVADLVVVVLSPDAPEPHLSRAVTFVRDTALAEGPLAGLAAGLVGAASDEAVLVVGGDMPSMSPKVLSMLVGALGREHRAAALGEPPTDRARPLPIAVRAGPASEAAHRLLASGERRLRALLEVLPVAVVSSEAWLAEDPEGDSLRDVDTPSDLRAHRPPLG